jgi:hypothetical protein
VPPRFFRTFVIEFIIAQKVGFHQANYLSHIFCCNFQST